MLASMPCGSFFFGAKQLRSIRILTVGLSWC